MVWGRRVLKRILIGYLLLSLMPVSNLGAQDFPFLRGATPFTLGSVTFTPAARIGCERIGLNFNLPLADGNALDLSLRNANLALGELGILAGFGDRFALFANAGGTLRKNLVVSTFQEPLEAGRFSVDWTGTQFQEGYIEAGLLYSWSDDISLVGGLRRTRFLMKLTDPRTEFGPINFSKFDAVSINILNIFFYDFNEIESQRYSADFNTGIWMPYVGVQLKGQSYRASLIGSPIGWVQIGIPFGLQQSESTSFSVSILSFLFSFSDRDNRESQINYKFNRAGVFLEGSFEYDFPLARKLDLNLWARGSWMHFRGAGSAGYGLEVTDKYAILLQEGNTTLFDFQKFIESSSASSASAQGSLNIYTYSLGVSAVLSF
jgi:hypothetical protein